MRRSPPHQPSLLTNSLSLQAVLAAPGTILERGDLAACNRFLRAVIERVELKFETRQAGKKNRHTLMRVVVRLHGAANGMTGTSATQ